MSREGRARWDLWSRLFIGDRDDPMIVRHRLIQTPWFGVYVHHIHRADRDRDLHDHPWSFFTVVLRGGYAECFKTVGRHPRVRTWLRGSWHAMKRHQAHRITAVLPGTRTLVFVGRRRSSWGFWTEYGWVDYREYLGGQRYSS